jgi:hypothetical protein
MSAPGDPLALTPEELTPTPQELAELDALAAEAADPASWKRWERQAARQAVERALCERVARNFGRPPPDWDWSL